MKKLSTTVTLLLCSLLTSFAQLSGSGTESDPYRIMTPLDLDQVRGYLNQEGVYFKLMYNLNMSDWLSNNYPGQGWQPIGGTTSEPFKGIFDGNGKTISGFSITRTSTNYVGLFGVVSGATIKNLTIKGNISGKAYVGSLFGSGSATVTNYSFEGTVTGTGNYVGGVGGSQTTASSDITVSATVNGADYTGGVYGSGKGLTSASFTGQITGSNYTGGLEGQGSGTFSSCTVNAPVTSEWYIGGLVGFLTSTISFNNCTQQGNVTGTYYTGGFVGLANYNISASNSTHEGNVKGVTDTGGLVGRANSNITFNNCTQRGNVTKNTEIAESYTGGIGGIIGSSTSGAVTLTSCYAEGDITGTENVGGICGAMTNPKSSNISSCSYWGNISGTSQLGGVVGAIIADNTPAPDFTATTTADTRADDNNNYKYIHIKCFFNTATPSFKYKYNSTSGWYDSYVLSSNIASDIDDWKITTTYVYSYTGSTYYTTGTNAPKGVQTVYNNVKTNGTNINIAISNCSAVGNINGSGAYIGGIVGQDREGCQYTQTSSKTVYYYKGYKTNTSTTSLTLRKYSASYTTSNITDSYFSGNLTGTSYLGGIAGTKQGGCINRCYASASISGNQYVGGIAGSLSKESLSTNENSMSANVSVCPSITGTSNVGKIYGATDGNFSVAANGSSTCNRSLATTQLVINGIAQPINDNLQDGTSVGLDPLRVQNNYNNWGWDFTNNWTMINTETFPYKSWQAAPPTISSGLVSGSTSISGKSVNGGTVYIKIGKGEVQSVSCSGTTFTLSGIAPLQSGAAVQLYAKASGKEASYINQYNVEYPGGGTENDPWLVYTAEDLQGVYKYGYYKQMNDIDLTSWISANSASAGWVPVGYNGSQPIYYDGGNHKVTGLWTNTTKNYVGLFSSFSQGTICNLTVEVATGKQVKGGNNTGIVIGRIGGGTIENVKAKGNVSAGSLVGGIAGYTEGTALKQLSFTGQLTATGGVGGITSGCSSSTSVTDCEAKDITIIATPNASNQCVGGLVANANNSSLNNCYVSGTITVNSNTSYTGEKVGGLVALCSGTVSECATDATISSAISGSMVGGLVGNKQSGGITHCSSAGSVTSTGENSYTGGLVGVLNSQVTDSYSTAQVTGTEYTAGLVGYNYGSVNRCYASGNIYSSHWAAGLIGYNDGASAVVTNCVAFNSMIEVSNSQWGFRVIAGYKNGAPDPDETCLYAWSGMQVSANGTPKQVEDNMLEGHSHSEAELKQQATYEAMGWDFSDVWTMSADGYPVLKWQLEASEPDVTLGDLSGDGKVSITDIVMIIDVIAGTITDANKVAAADVNGDGNVSITDCVAAIDLIAAQASTPSSARRKANAMLSDTDFITAAMQENVLNISLDNERHYTAFQMTVSVPEGMTLGRATMDKMRGADHLVTVRDLGRGQYLVAGFSADNEELMAGSGRLLSIITEGQADADIVISDIEFATTQAEAYYLADVAVSGTPTGIKAIENGKLKIENGVYDLQGRRVTKATKGIYIYNGKKTIIK